MFSAFISLTLAGRLIKALESADPNLFFIKSFGSRTGACFTISKGWGERSAEKPPVAAQGSSTSAGAARAVISERLVVNLMAQNELLFPALAFIKPPILWNVSMKPTHGRPLISTMTVRPQDDFFFWPGLNRAVHPVEFWAVYIVCCPRDEQLSWFNSNSLNVHTFMLDVVQRASRVRTLLRPCTHKYKWDTRTKDVLSEMA